MRREACAAQPSSPSRLRVKVRQRVLLHLRDQALPEVEAADHRRPWPEVDRVELLEQPGAVGVVAGGGGVAGAQAASPSAQADERRERRGSGAERRVELGGELLVGRVRLHLAVDEEGRRRVDLVGRRLAPDTRRPAPRPAPGPAGRRSSASSVRPAWRPIENSLPTISCSSSARRPVRLPVEQHVDDAEVALCGAQRAIIAGPEARPVEVDLAVDEPHLAGVDVVRLDLREHRRRGRPRSAGR